MLGHKDRMALHWCLSAVIFRVCGSKSLSDKINGMGADRFHAILIDVLEIRVCQLETGSEIGSIQFFKSLLSGLHRLSPYYEATGLRRIY